MQHKRKLLGAAVGFVVLVVACFVCVYVYQQVRRSGTAAVHEATKAPMVYGALQTLADNTLTVVLQDGTKQSFTISSTTQVVSRVTNGEVGKSLDSVSEGTLLLIQPDDVTAHVAYRVTIVPTIAAPENASKGPPILISGTVVTIAPTEFTVSTANNPNVLVSFTKNTPVLSNVLAGQQGKTIDDLFAGAYVSISGVAGPHSFDAHSIQVLIPIGQ